MEIRQNFQTHYELYGDGIGCVEYIDHMGTDLSVVKAARVSYAGNTDEWQPEKDEKLINYLLRNRHTSPFEHTSLTFRVVVPLFVRSQWHRHRTWAYNEISRRYTSDKIEFYVPQTLRKQAAGNKQCTDEESPFSDVEEQIYLSSIRVHHDQCLYLYEDLISNGVGREIARGVLPNNLYTEYYGTVSLHNLMHFLGLRCHEHAQYEIRVAADACRAIATDLFPVSMKAWENLRAKTETT